MTASLVCFGTGILAALAYVGSYTLELGSTLRTLDDVGEGGHVRAMSRPRTVTANILGITVVPIMIVGTMTIMLHA